MKGKVTLVVQRVDDELSIKPWHERWNTEGATDTSGSNCLSFDLYARVLCSVQAFTCDSRTFMYICRALLP
jgi:hypothetical protein